MDGSECRERKERTRIHGEGLIGEHDENGDLGWEPVKWLQSLTPLGWGCREHVEQRPRALRIQCQWWRVSLARQR